MLDTNIKFDFKKLHQELSNTYKRQRELKKWLYLDYSITHEEAQRKLRKAVDEFWLLSYRMTMLCCILNHAKGKLHMSFYHGKPFDREKQEEFIRWSQKEFILESPSTGIVATVQEPPMATA